MDPSINFYAHNETFHDTGSSHMKENEVCVLELDENGNCELSYLEVPTENGNCEILYQVVPTENVNCDLSYLEVPTENGNCEILYQVVPTENVNCELSYQEVPTENVNCEISFQEVPTVPTFLPLECSELQNNFYDEGVIYSEEVEIKEELDGGEKECFQEKLLSEGLWWEEVKKARNHVNLQLVPDALTHFEDSVVFSNEEIHEVDEFGSWLSREGFKNSDANMDENNNLVQPVTPRYTELTSITVQDSYCGSLVNADSSENYRREEAGEIESSTSIESLNPFDLPSTSDIKKENDLFQYDNEVKNEMPFFCQRCQYYGQNESDIANHLKQYNCRNMHKCSLCEYKCTLVRAMEAHVISHKKKNSLVCSICFYRTTNKASFNRHINGHKKMKRYNCSLCDYKAVQSSALTMHMRRHYGVKPYQCQYCVYKTGDRSSLNRHVRTHTGEKPQWCSICDYKCIQSTSLKFHMRKHVKENFECDNCGFKTTRKTDWSQHHCKLLYKCEFCPYQTKYLCLSRSHRRIHSGKKPFSCTSCQYKTTYKSHLDRHMLRHTAIKPMFCFVCDYRCSQYYSLETHMKKHEGMRIVCAFCNFELCSSVELFSHLKSQHKTWWK